MGLLSSKNSWSSQAKGSGGFFHPEKKCPPVNDCDVKKFLGTRRTPATKTKKELRAEAEKQRKAKKAATEAKRQRSQQKSSGGWPFAGRYDPNKGQEKKGFWG